jgi:aminopeptidase
VSLSFEGQLRNYADLAVQVGVNLQAGQRLIVRAPVESAPLVRLIAERAYKSGARLVDVMWGDDAVTLARFKYAPRDSFEEFPDWQAQGLIEATEQGDALLSVYAADPDLLKEQDPELVALTERVRQTRLQSFYKKITSDATNWSIVAFPIPSWAAKVFPDAPPEQQVARLWQAIFTACRVDRPDPAAAWQEHTRQLAARRDYLTGKQYTALTYRAPGTDFRVGLPEQHEWHAGQKDTLTGIPFIANIPTEEVFTTPHKEQTEGVVSSTKPLSYSGVLIENFSLTFAAGRVVKVTAEKGEAVLKRLVETDEGAARLGEVALVPHSSPISKSGVMFYNTLFDENASDHLALGRAYRLGLKNGADMSDEAFAAAGGNDSLVHVDFMIGSNEMDIDGITAGGDAEPLMRGGEWVDFGF